MLDITAISKTFHPGTPNARQALRQLSLHLEDGEFATIVGSNGAGKSTLFGAIAGSFYTDEGRILLNGTDLTFQPEHRRSRVIGRLFQDPMRGTAPHMTIEENLALAYLRASHGSPFRRITAKDRERFRSQLAQLDMGLEDRMKQPVGLLSGGQRQRVAAARAMVKRPPLIFADEPTGALDSSSATELLFALSEVNQTLGTTILMVTHDPYAASYTDRILYFKDGHIISELKRCNRDRRDFYEEIMLEAARQDKQR